MNIGTLDVYGRPTININMRCIEMGIGGVPFNDGLPININMRCIEIINNTLSVIILVGLTLT